MEFKRKWARAKNSAQKDNFEDECMGGRLHTWTHDVVGSSENKI